MKNYLLLLAGILTLAHSQKSPEIPTIEHFNSGKEKFGGLTTVNPGLKIRIAQGLTDILQQNLILYGMTYLNIQESDLEEHNFFINIWPLNLDLRWHNIIREPVQIDFSSFIF